jgi:hypothetical protein
MVALLLCWLINQPLARGRGNGPSPLRLGVKHPAEAVRVADVFDALEDVKDVPSASPRKILAGQPSPRR